MGNVLGSVCLGSEGLGAPAPRPTRPARGRWLRKLPAMLFSFCRQKTETLGGGGESNKHSRVTQKEVSWKDSGSAFHDPSRSGTWTSSTKSALAQVTREQSASQSHRVRWRGEEMPVCGGFLPRRLTHPLPLDTLIFSVAWFLLFSPAQPPPSFFSRSLSFLSVSVSPHPT